MAHLNLSTWPPNYLHAEANAGSPEGSPLWDQGNTCNKLTSVTGPCPVPHLSITWAHRPPLLVALCWGRDNEVAAAANSEVLYATGFRRAVEGSYRRPQWFLQDRKLGEPQEGGPMAGLDGSLTLRLHQTQSWGCEAWTQRGGSRRTKRPLCWELRVHTCFFPTLINETITGYGKNNPPPHHSHCRWSLWGREAIVFN